MLLTTDSKCGSNFSSKYNFRPDTVVKVEHRPNKGGAMHCCTALAASDPWVWHALGEIGVKLILRELRMFFLNKTGQLPTSNREASLLHF